MDWDVLIPILMFLFPLVVSILDKRAKKRKGVPPVKAEPLFPPAPDGSEVRPEERPAAQDPSQPFGWAPPSYDAEGGTVSTGRTPEPIFPAQEAQANEAKHANEGQRAVERHIDTATQDDDKPKLEIDKKKLILYSEILKPKFDA
ncbi:MAG: hypothetical protein Q4E27_02210 [Bacteroidales bacterium]|nr:hypothetical protein [Bacteroidales bacterium]